MQHLDRRGLKVTRPMLESDVHDHYLPAPETTEVQGRGRQGIWSAIVLSRAEYLYRLRRRGVQGQRLKLLLFLFDGWGWQYVRATVLEGLKKTIAANQIGIRSAIRTPTLSGLQFVFEEAVAFQRKLIEARLPDPLQSTLRDDASLMAFVWGLGLFGKPLEGGSLESLKPLMSGMNPQFDDAAIEIAMEIAESIFLDTPVTFENAIKAVESITNEYAATSLKSVKYTIHSLRKYVRRSALKDNKASVKTNILTMFGYWEKSRSDGFWQNIPERITPAQVLGAIIGILIAGDYVMDHSVFGMTLNMMQAFLESAANAEPLE